jgi:hypothetical protein
MPTALRLLTILTLALAGACSRGGAKLTPPRPPSPVVVTPGRCLTQPPPGPPASLVAMADDGDLSPEQEEWLWTYLEVLEGYARRAWKVCGRAVVAP